MKAVVARLLALDTPSVSDALDKLGLPGAIFGVGPMTVQSAIAGPVVTVKLGAPLANLPKRHLGAGAIMSAEDGDIIVVEHRGRIDVSGWGGLLSRGALAKGVAGVLIDGAFRDVDEARSLGLAIYARAVVPITARGRVAEHGFSVPITFAGIAVSPGDYVLADGSGVVFLARDNVTSILAEAEAIYKREQLMARSIEQGEPIGDVLGANYEDMLKRD
ncbi:MAG: RraA family protein [Sphingomonas sp.]|uniref:RraA family protein n=1 Tax=Sphingomonas sp. TaxID=28214 RepID=UPI001ACFA460|nr:RraA family protein [Sphingomonas sp.]MBN8816503.1 RraA family protein [Sphingomonas sp.]